MGFKNEIHILYHLMLLHETDYENSVKVINPF